MSTTDLQEHSYLKVLYDFKYKTAEGRQIVIQKDEKLYLLQKTNNDWWQVIRTREQRSFYVPATYVREIRRTAFLGRRKSEEDKDVNLKLPDSPSYENMPKDYVDNTRSVEKWLAGTIECMQGSSKESDNMEAYCKLDKSESTNFREMKVGLEQIKSEVEKPEKSKSDGSGVKDEKKRLELFKSVIKRFSSGTNSLDDARPEKVEKSSKINKRSSNSSKDTDDKSEISGKAHKCYRVKEIEDGCEESLNVGKRLSTSPKDLEMYSRFEGSPQNLFHKELESNLERRNQRKISGNMEYEKLTKEEYGNFEKQSLKKKDNIAEGVMLKTSGKFDNLNMVRSENLSKKHESNSLDRQLGHLDVTTIENVPKVIKGSLDRENNARKVNDTSEGTHKIIGSLERSVHNELRSSLERAFIKHCGNSSEKSLVTPDFQTCVRSFNSDKCSSDENQSTKRHVVMLPHEHYSSKDALIPNKNLAFNESADRILNDKRKSWAVEELMTELTQMRRERVENKKPNFELESVEIKDSFHPLDKLTQELHEMHASCPESDTVISNVQSNVKENDTSSINICNISVNVAHKESGTKYNDICEATIDNGTSTESESHEAVTTEMPKSIQYSQVDTEICKPIQTLSENTFTFEKSSNVRPSPLNTSITHSPKIIKSPKSPKILDEYNEANILNDIDNTTTVCSIETFDGASSLSFDKECQLSSYQGHSKMVQLGTDNFEKPCYSNVLLNSEKVKLRPKLKIKAKNIGAEIKLTPSLEKLASEIQFLPANRVSVIDNGSQQNVLSENSILARTMQQEENRHLDIDNGSSKSDDAPNSSADREIWKKFKSKLGYKGSFKIKQKEKVSKSKRDSDTNKASTDLISQSRKSNLNKFATFHYATSEYYQRCPREKSFMYFGPEVAIRKQLKRKSCSLGDLTIDECIDSSTENLDSALEVSKKNQCKPVPSPRTKVSPVKNAVVSINLNTTQHDKGERITTNESYNKLASKPIPVRRKLSKDNALHAVDSEFSQSCKEAQCQLNVTVPAVSRSYQNLNKDLTNLKIIDVKHSTAVGFKTLLCTSDSGSDEYLQFKTFPKSLQKDSDHGIFKSDSKLNLTVKVNTDSLNAMCRSVSDEQILSSNASSEVLLSQSESEINLTSELSDNPSPINVSDDKEASENFINLPPGWKQQFDENTKQICFVNDRGDKWFSSNDAEGKIYFFEENSNESSWVLPNITIGEPSTTSANVSYQDVEVRNISSNEKVRVGKTHSMVLINQSAISQELATRKSSSIPRDWPQLFDGNMCVLMEGTINRTKITENGKKLKKNWSASHVVLTELFLLFFKDAKTFAVMKSGQSPTAKPDISVDLNGALIEPGERASSRKNVYIISTVLGLQVLIQSDNVAVANEWYQAIHTAIRCLPSSFETYEKPSPSIERPHEVNSKTFLDTNSPEETKKCSKVGRSRSVKIKRPDGSLEDLSGTVAERQTKIKAKLRRFFQRRPTVDLLVKNGIYKDEPAFGSYLNDVCPIEPPRVPRFVKTCIEILESNTENMKADGLYRASGNLSQIQKIRLQVDQNNLEILKREDDVHVLTGALKLFFRELKEPLIPFAFFEKALNASMSKKKLEKVQCFREIVKALPATNHDTLQFLLQHLLRVTTYQEYNRMHIPNLAIVFGPTLMWPAEESANMALDLMQQNLVIECFLSEYDRIFK